MVNDMQIEKILKQTATAENNVNQVTRSEVKLEQATQGEVGISDPAMCWGIFIGFFLASVVLFMMVLKIQTVGHNKIFFPVKNLQKVPCNNCIFFSDNLYLKCAVQPSIVLTNKAMKCSDYAPRNGNLFSEISP